MKVLFVMNGDSGTSGQPGVSGGDIMLIEIAKRWLQKGVRIHFLTSSAGRELCERMGLQAIYHESSSSYNPLILNYVLLTLKMAMARPKFLTKVKFDLVYSSCEHLYDVLPALKMKKRNAKWVAMAHFVPALPWKRLRAGITNAVFSYLNHMLGALLIRENADLIFAVSNRTASDYITKLKFDKRRVTPVPGGVDYGQIRAIANVNPRKEYDAIYIKRLHPLKGTLDLIEIWYRVVGKCPNTKLLIVGLGSEELLRTMYQRILKFDLIKNIEIVGPIYDTRKKISLLAKSKLFILPSYEENWAIVIGEALTVGLPLVAYDLPEIRPIWGDHVLWVPKGDMKSFADEVVKLLSNERYYQMYVGKGISHMKQYDWDNIAEKELELCIKLTGYNSQRTEAP